MSENLDEFIDVSDILASNIVDINIAHKKTKSISPHKSGAASAPDANIREEISVLKLKQHFIRQGYDLQVDDTRHLLESYDARVYSTKYDHCWKVQIKTCYLSSMNNTHRFEIRNVSAEDLKNKYKDVPIFVFYVCYDHATAYGLEHRSRIYIVRNIDLQKKIEEWGYRDIARLPLNSIDNFWVAHCAKFDIFNEDLTLLNNVLIKFKSDVISEDIVYTIGELSDAEIVCKELGIEFDAILFHKFMHNNSKFDAKSFKKYMKKCKNG